MALSRPPTPPPTLARRRAARWRAYRTRSRPSRRRKAEVQGNMKKTDFQARYAKAQRDAAAAKAAASAAKAASAAAAAAQSTLKAA